MRNTVLTQGVSVALFCFAKEQYDEENKKQEQIAWSVTDVELKHGHASSRRCVAKYCAYASTPSLKFAK